MALIRQPLDAPEVRLPSEVDILLDETADLLYAWQDRAKTASFVPADYVQVYDALALLRRGFSGRVPRFLEWGSGLGIVTMMAASLGYQACGVEIDAALVAESKALAKRFGYNVRYVNGNIFPWEPGPELPASIHPARFDLVYVYPWPDQEIRVFDLFDQQAETGALLLAYYGIEDLRLFRKH